MRGQRGLRRNSAQPLILTFSLFGLKPLALNSQRRSVADQRPVNLVKGGVAAEASGKACDKVLKSPCLS